MKRKNILREHVKAMHPRLSLRRKQADLSRDHAEQHYRYSPNHYHAGENLGPSKRPSGWYTGEDAVLKS
jgi:hypothetical protein